MPEHVHDRADEDRRGGVTRGEPAWRHRCGEPARRCVGQVSRRSDVRPERIGDDIGVKGQCEPALVAASDLFAHDRGASASAPHTPPAATRLTLACDVRDRSSIGDATRSHSKADDVGLVEQQHRALRRAARRHLALEVSEVVVTTSPKFRASISMSRGVDADPTVGRLTKCVIGATRDECDYIGSFGTFAGSSPEANARCSPSTRAWVRRKAGRCASCESTASRRMPWRSS